METIRDDLASMQRLAKADERGRALMAFVGMA